MLSMKWKWCEDGRSHVRSPRNGNPTWLATLDDEVRHGQKNRVPYFPLNPGCLMTGSLYNGCYYNPHITG